MVLFSRQARHRPSCAAASAGGSSQLQPAGPKLAQRCSGGPVSAPASAARHRPGCGPGASERSVSASGSKPSSRPQARQTLLRKKTGRPQLQR